MTRRFEFIGGNLAKFWEVAVSGDDVTVRYRGPCRAWTG